MKSYQLDYEVDHKEERRAYDAARYASHREEMREQHAAYRAAHREEKCAYSAAYHRDHRDARLEKMRQDRAEFHEWLQVFRTVNGCEGCETREGRLEHHHVDPDTKRYNVSDMCNFSMDALEDELEKCVVLCMSCHRNRHIAMDAA